MPRQIPTVAFLEIDGMVLSGEELEEYCKSHGLCRRCAKVRTHRRVLKLFGRGEKWEPLTLHDEETGEYTVYRGFCLKPTCFTVGQAKRLLGETREGRSSGGGGHQSSGGGKSRRSNGGGGGGGGSSGSRGGQKQRASERLMAGSTFGGIKRPSRRKPRTNPETGSVMSGTGNDDASIGSDISGVSGMSGMSSRSNASILSTISAMSGMSGFSFGGGGRKRGGRRSGSNNRRSSSASWSGSSVSSGISDFSTEDDDITVDSTMTGSSAVKAGRDAPPAPGTLSPIVAHRVEQLVTYDYFTVLDLTKVEMRPEDIDAVVAALGQTRTLEIVTLDRCKLKDVDVEKLADGLEAGGHINIKKLSLRHNMIGNRGVQAFEFLFKSSPTLEELDLSENSISSQGAALIFTAFHSNRHKSALAVLNLAQNEIWDLDDGSFLRHTTTLKELNLDGNFMHDEGAEHLGKSLGANKNCVLEKLFLGWNGIADDGAAALAKMIEANNSLQVLGLAENDITNTGARAILSALAINGSMREISGLYHNQIDRKFIIVAIKRLLHRSGDRTEQAGTRESEMFSAEVNAKQEQAPMPVNSYMHEEAKIGEGEESSSDGSVNWAAQLYANEPPDKPTYTQSRANVATIALEAIENWDWGTFGIEEIENSTDFDDGLLMKDFDDDNGDDDVLGGSNKVGNNTEVSVAPAEVITPTAQDCVPVHSKGLPTDRVVVFQSAPLAYFDRKTTQHHEVPLIDFEYESTALKEALADSEAIGADIELLFQTATSDRFRDFFAQGLSTVMHLSCHGNGECIALENGFGYMNALQVDELTNYVSASKGKVQVIVIASVHARHMANAFILAGAPHVVCLERNATFRDNGPVEFAKGFYVALGKNLSVQEAFNWGMECVKKSPLIKKSKHWSRIYRLLPERGNHDAKAFFQRPLPKTPEYLEVTADTSMLPKVPDQFVGREVDMYEILESLRVDDVIRLGGPPGSGKASILAALSRYILDRPKSFQINSVFWLPPVPGMQPDPDTLYGDLCKVMTWLIEAEDDIWDDEEYTETRERIMVELEDQRTILVIDGRAFTSEVAGEMLERFLTHLLNEASLKIILITASDSSRSKTRRSRSEETIIHLGPLDFKASALLFGNACPFVSVEGNPMVYTAEEFHDYLVPPSLAKPLGDPSADSKKAIVSRRQKELYERMGHGNPRKIIELATSCTERDLYDMLRVAKRPEVVNSISSANELETERTKLDAAKSKAIASKNYLRAKDLVETLDDLAALREKFPSLDDLKIKEADLKKKFSDLLRAKRYDDANLVKRKILSVKRAAMKERYAKPETSQVAALRSLESIQQRIDDMMALAQNMDKSFPALDYTAMNGSDGASLHISPFCTLHITGVGSVVEFDYKEGMSGIVCWTNEACDLSTHETGKKLLAVGGSSLLDEVADIQALLSTEWGLVKCATGEALSVGPRSFGQLSARHIILSVTPLSPTNDDTEWDGNAHIERGKLPSSGGSNAAAQEDGLHYMETGLRAAMRSTFRTIKKTGVEAVAIPTITTKAPTSCNGNTGKPVPPTSTTAYARCLNVVLETIVEESKSMDASLKQIHLVASSVDEAGQLIKAAVEMGLSLVSAVDQ
jgi:hypothetical protein